MTEELTELRIKYQTVDITEGCEGPSRECVVTEHTLQGANAEDVSYIMTTFRQFMDEIGVPMALQVSGPRNRRTYTFTQAD